MKFAFKIYRWLAEAFPHEFKLAYGEEITQLGEEVVEDIAKRHGTAGLARLIADIAVRVPVEYLSEMRRDTRYAVRALIKSPGFALVGIISIGLGIGLATNVYSSELQMLFRQLPGAANVNRLATPEHPVSYYYVEQYRDQKNLFSGVAAFQNNVPFNITFQSQSNTKPERVFGQLVSPDYFSVLGVQPQYGRVFSAALDKSGDAPVVVISDRFWRNRLNSSPDAVGQVLRLNGQTATIIGITPKKFAGAATENPAELFVPTTVPAALAPELANDVLHQRNARNFLAIMCLATGVTIDYAEAGLNTINRSLDEQVASASVPADKNSHVSLMAADNTIPLPRKFKRLAIVLFGVLMALIMSLACMNLSNMLLARAANRRKELAIRLSVGASRFRLLRQMMSEGILLSLLGGGAGFAFAYWLSVLNSQFNQSVGGPLGPDLTLDWHAAVFAFALAVLCGIVLSLLPALQATKADLTPALKEGSALQLPGHRRFGLRNLIMVGQVAGSLMLLLITGFLVLGIDKVSTVRTKFDPNTMYLLHVDPVRDGYTPAKAQTFFEQLPQRLKSSRPSYSVTLTEQAPFSVEESNTQVTTEKSRMQKPVVEETIGASYFAALSEPMLAGREFVERDQRSQAEASPGSYLPVVLNASAARGFFGYENAIGEHLKDDKQSYEVIGVARDLNNSFGTRESVIYLPLTSADFAQPPAGGMTIMVRADAGGDTLNAIRGQVASIAPDLTIFNAQTLSNYLDDSRANMRFAVRTYGGIGLFGLVLAAIGLAGITAYAVAQRRKEIGIRTAIGASKAQVLRLVLREGATLVSVGTILGFLGAIVIAKVLSSIAEILVEAFRVGTNDPRLLLGAPILLAAIAMIACYLPARRAAKIDPLQALRQE